MYPRDVSRCTPLAKTDFVSIALRAIMNRSNISRSRSDFLGDITQSWGGSAQSCWQGD